MLNKIVDDIYTYMYYKNMIDYFSFFFYCSSLKNIGGEYLRVSNLLKNNSNQVFSDVETTK